ncbi:hypothetical protein Clacol_009630 [Clathrus columnatus]|uniref:HNH nuclease domain-containing protein n=1 Tax=Clathrus columnatus TaxID=1419009 RepID=A0AAV5ARI2_9AGAM|nr:hypothetical protein Clacol_009630 [Clathrus columnatus]
MSDSKRIAELDANTIFKTTSTNEVISDDSITLSVLTQEARNIADESIEQNITTKKNAHVSLGGLLHALLDYASNDELPDGTTGIRHTAGVICTSYKEGRLQETALVWIEHMLWPTREDYRCAVHRNEVDVDSEDLTERREGDVADFRLEGCPILPLSSSSFYEKGNKEVWASFDIQLLVGEGSNDTNNGILMDKALHDAFGAFTIFFVPVDNEPNTYTVHSVKRKNSGYPRVKFGTRQGVAAPLPKLLEIHAAFAQALHASGAGAYFDEIRRDHEEIRVLATDGSTDTRILNYSLQTLAVR